MSRRRRKKEESLLAEVLDFASELPWWGVIVLAALVYGFLAVFIPYFFLLFTTGSETLALPLGIFGQLSRTIAPFIAGLVVLAGVVGGIRRWRDGRMLDAQSGVASLRELSWQEFERLLAVAYEREGYYVERTGGNGPDGGVDLRLFRDGALVLVQCKHWKVQKVNVKVVRELRGVMAIEGANGGVVVTSGAFTADAMEFARSSGIKLVDGTKLLEMVRSVQRSPSRQASPPLLRENGEMVGAPITSEIEAPLCPRCGGAMVRRVARRGANAGNPFWGCSAFPKCRGIVNLG